MLHIIVTGILFGWAIAIPIGPMNLEIIRRNLRFGTAYGVLLGVGICSADMTFLILLTLGALSIIKHTLVLQVVSVVGALILGWFGVNALRAKQLANDKKLSNNSEGSISLWSQFLWGYFMTLTSPFTILFWASVSSQIAALANSALHAGIGLAVGVALGITSWMLGLNIVIHFTKHRLSDNVIHCLNRIGGVLLLGFCVLGLWHAFHIQ